MFGPLILLIFGKLQDTFQETSRTWQWALAYGVIAFLLGGGTSLLGMIIGGVITGLYAWGYFKLLRNLADNLMLWLLVFLVGAVLPMLLGVALIGAAQKAA
ncbi:hypothetical protein [Kingella oralis]|jgi:hypothetical protein|uniref:hypothetical protein n=1 Tax=Kingella oralis TaxID=505 RepID=UPI0034E3C8DC